MFPITGVSDIPVSLIRCLGFFKQTILLKVWVQKWVMQTCCKKDNQDAGGLKTSLLVTLKK
jgi:hypothetical protein